MSVTVVRELPEEEWRLFVHEQPSGNVFHTPEMFEVYARTVGQRPQLWAARVGGSVKALMLPVEITLMGGLLRRLTTRRIVYGGLLAAPGAEGEKAAAALLSAYACETGGEALFTELRNLSDQQHLQPLLERHGFRYEPHLNYLVSLRRSPEAIMQGIGRRTRKKIRQALRKREVIIEEARTVGERDACYALLRQSYRMARVPLADRTLFEAAHQVLDPRGMIRFSLARRGEIAIGASVELLYREVIYGWYGGMDRAFGAYLPSELLTWQMLEWGATRGYGWYDFGGAGKPHEAYGVREFKAKFGGELVNYGRNTCVHAPLLLQVSEAAYALARRLLYR